MAAAYLCGAMGMIWNGYHSDKQQEARRHCAFAAASLTNALNDVAAQWTKAGHPAPSLAYASSSALAKQIDSGAPADIFASADLVWMEYLEDHGRITYVLFELFYKCRVIECFEPVDDINVMDMLFCNMIATQPYKIIPVTHLVFHFSLFWLAWVHPYTIIIPPCLCRSNIADLIFPFV